MKALVVLFFLFTQGFVVCFFLLLLLFLLFVGDIWLHFTAAARMFLYS